MTREELQELEKRLMEELVKRRKLGGYNSEAEALLLLIEAFFELVRHIREKTPRQKVKDDKAS